MSIWGMGVNKNFMKRTIVAAITLANYALVSIAFMLFLNWYDTGNLDFSGWRGMAISGLILGSVVLYFEFWLQQRISYQENKLLFFIRHTLIGTVGIVFSFALGNAVELLFESKTLTQMSSIFPMLLIIPLMAMFYFIMMIPFGVYLGITSSLLFHLTHSPHRE